ncbi:MAG: hypothetical protein Alis3KO_30790 [Aliiglaciecola sp.]
MKPKLSGASTIKMLQALLDVDASLHGLDYLQAIAVNLWKQFEFEYILFGYALKPTYTKIQTVVTLVRGEVGDNFVYDLMGTPCQNVFTGNRVCIHPEQVAERFPDDTMLVDMQVQSYIGAPTIVQGKLFGLIALLDSNKIIDTEYYSSFIEFVAARVSVELERYTNQHQIELLKRQAQRDPLTGLFNRHAFYNTVEIVSEDLQVSSLMFIDADDFKVINDTFGHVYGDDVLRFIAETINQCIRASDVLGRFGGEEFVIYLPGIDLEGAKPIADRIHQKIRDNSEFNITLSIGLTSCDSTQSLDNMIERADKGVYQAKRQGKNQTCIV